MVGGGRWAVGGGRWAVGSEWWADDVPLSQVEVGDDIAVLLYVGRNPTFGLGLVILDHGHDTVIPVEEDGPLVAQVEPELLPQPELEILGVFLRKALGCIPHRRLAGLTSLAAQPERQVEKVRDLDRPVALVGVLEPSQLTQPLHNVRLGEGGDARRASTETLRQVLEQQLAMVLYEGHGMRHRGSPDEQDEELDPLGILRPAHEWQRGEKRLRTQRGSLRRVEGVAEPPQLRCEHVVIAVRSKRAEVFGHGTALVFAAAAMQLLHRLFSHLFGLR